MAEIDWYQEATQPKAAPAPAETDWYKAVTQGDGSSLGNQDKRTRMGGPDVVDSLDTPFRTGTIARSSLAVDFPTQIKRLSDSTGIPEKRFGVIDGNIVYSDDAGQIRRVVPSVFGGDRSQGLLPYLGETAQRGARYVASGLGPGIPQAAGAGAGVMAGPTAASVPIAAGAAFAADVGRQELDKAIAGESLSLLPQSYDPNGIDYLNATGHGAQAAFGQGLGVGAVRAFSRNPLQISPFDRRAATDPETLRAARQAYTEGQGRGINLSFGQATGLPSALAGERQLARDAASMDTIRNFYDTQRGQVNTAVRNMAEDIAPMQSRDAGVNALRQGAENAIASRQGFRAEMSAPEYREAFTNAAGEPNTVPGEAVAGRVIDRINGLLQLQPENATLRNARDLLFAKDAEGNTIVRFGQPALKTRVDQLHETKTLIDRLIEGADTGRAVDNATRAALRGVQETLLTSLDDAVPAYGRARSMFRMGSPAIEALQEGPVGTLAEKVAPGVPREAGLLFDPERATPTAVSEARTAYERSGQIGRWNEGLSTYVQEVLAKNNGSAAGIHRALFGREFDSRPRDVMRAAMTPQQYGAFDQLMRVLDNVAQTLPEGSQTATDIMGGQRLREQFGSIARMAGNLFSPMRIADVGGRAGERVALRLSDEGMARLAEAVTAPDSVQRLAQLRMLNPTSQRAMTLAMQILTGTGATQTGNHLFPRPDRAPELPANGR